MRLIAGLLLILLGLGWLAVTVPVAQTEPAEIEDKRDSDDNLSIWLAFAGFSIIALMAWLRRKRVK